MVLFLEAEVPFADKSAVVSRLLEQDGHQFRILAQVAPIVCRVSPDDPGHSGHRRVPSAQQRCPGWRTDRAVGVEVIEAHPAGADPVDVRGPDILSSIARQVAVAQVISEDDENVRAFSSRRGRGHQQGGEEACEGAQRY